MRQWLVALAVWVVLGLSFGPARAWNDTGHEVVALIAWDNLSEQTRQKVVELMQQAPTEAGLTSLFAQDNRPAEVRAREFFRLASTWPDLARSTKPRLPATLSTARPGTTGTSSGSRRLAKRWTCRTSRSPRRTSWSAWSISRRSSPTQASPPPTGRSGLPGCSTSSGTYTSPCIAAPG
jgi:hypothetical protein